MQKKIIGERFGENKDTQKGKFLTFSLGKELYGDEEEVDSLSNI